MAGFHCWQKRGETGARFFTRRLVLEPALLHTWSPFPRDQMTNRGVAHARVLLVDDEPDQVEMYALTLQRVGFHVIAAYTGEAAIARALDSVPDVIVLDVRLPDMTGWDVCGMLKTDDRTRHIPIVLLTAAVSPNLEQRAADAGCATHLIKPCYPDELTVAVRNVLAAA
jgi:CheY-like chemotaxis protein